MAQTEVRVVQRSLLVELCQAAGWRTQDVLSVTFTKDTIQARLFARDADGELIPIPGQPGKVYTTWAMALVGDSDA